MSWLPIGEDTLLSDRHSAAIVSSGGSVDRLCMPRFDSPSICAAILDDEAGHLSIRPHTEFRGERWQEWSELHQNHQGPRRHLVHLSGRVLQALCSQPMADSAAARWYQPDNGIWEVCAEPRRFVHSKAICWVALDRAIRFADLLGARDHVGGWKAAAEEIRAAVETQGWDEDQRSYTQSFGSPDLDATVLRPPIVVFLSPDNPRVLSSIDAVREQLTDARGLGHRYHTGSGVDGLDGQEGAFLRCTFWLARPLARPLALAGWVAEGTEVLECAAAYANDLGLLGEEVDSTTGDLLGNFPQAFSHIDLVGAAWALSPAGRRPSAAEV